MISPATLQRGLYALLFAALAALHIFARVLPIEGTFGDMPPPELIVLAGFAWVAQRPDYVPVAMFAALACFLAWTSLAIAKGRLPPPT